jgi:carbon-monoxide dehydrogenase medium subunit
MRPFEYVVPKDLDEACSLLSKYKEDAKVLAGGQSLVPLLRQRLIAPQYVIDIKRLPGLEYIREESAGLKIGALATHRTVETSPVVAKKFPILVEAEYRLAHRQVRNWGTVGGNLSHADPGGDLGPPLLALGAEVKVASTRGERTISLSRFFTDYLVTVIEPDEILVEIGIPYFKPHSGGAYRKESIRAGDRPIAAVAAAVSLNGKGDTIEEARIALGGVGLTPIEAKEAAQSLVGKKATEATVLEAGTIAAREARPTADVEGSEEYKRHMVHLLTRDMLNLAIERAHSG